MYRKIFELIVNASCVIPNDVEKALRSAMLLEEDASIARKQLMLMLENAKIAKEKMRPICQDTGMLYFIVKNANFAKKGLITKAINDAVKKASKEGFLRSNTVCSLSGKSVPSNVFQNCPYIEFSDLTSKKMPVEISLLLKGGGSENIGTQYSLPDERIGAERDMEGIRRAILDSAIQAQGKGCPPGAIAVCVGGDRGSAYIEAKKLFFKNIGQRNKNPDIAKLELEWRKDINMLGIGPQGLGGKTFALELFINFMPRHPATFFVTISHICWAWRRARINLEKAVENRIHI